MVTFWKATARSSARSSLFARRCARTTRLQHAATCRAGTSNLRSAPMHRCLSRMRCGTRTSPTRTYRPRRTRDQSSKPRDFRATAKASLLRSLHCRDHSAIRRSRSSMHSSSRSVEFDPCDQEILQRARGAWLHQPVVRDARTRLPVRVPPRLVRGFVPCAQLIYCRDVSDLVRFAGPVGRVLARHGRPLVLIDANGPISGLLGWFGRGRMPRYFKGPTASEAR